MKKIYFVCLFTTLLSWQTGKSQILISLLLGDKLNSPNIEFGLDGGFSFTQMRGVENATYLRTFNLGFYFDFKFKKPGLMLNTGLRVKSNMGANKVGVYPVGDANLDSLFKADASVTRKLSYFYVPVLLKYQFENHLYVEGGLQMGLRHKSYDSFTQNVNGSELTYTFDISNLYKHLDAGLTAGVGYRLMGGNGMNLGLRMYYGLANVSAKSGAEHYNSGYYINVGIPIGKNPKK